MTTEKHRTGVLDPTSPRANQWFIASSSAHCTAHTAERYRADFCEERSDEANPRPGLRAQRDGDCFVAALLAMTNQRSQPENVLVPA